MALAIPGPAEQIVDPLLDMHDASIDRGENREQKLGHGHELEVRTARHAKATALDVLAQRFPAPSILVDEMRIAIRIRDAPIAIGQVRVAALFVGDLVLVHDQRPPGLPSRGGGGASMGSALPSLLPSIAFSWRPSCTVSEYM